VRAFQFLIHKHNKYCELLIEINVVLTDKQTGRLESDVWFSNWRVIYSPWPSTWHDLLLSSSQLDA